MTLGSASGAHVPKARSAPVLTDHHFRHALTRFQGGANQGISENTDG